MALPTCARFAELYVCDWPSRARNPYCTLGVLSRELNEEIACLYGVPSLDAQWGKQHGRVA